MRERLAHENMKLELQAEAMRLEELKQKVDAEKAKRLAEEKQKEDEEKAKQLAEELSP